MALVTKSVVAAGGADYTTVQSAVNAVDVTSDQWDIEIDDDSLYSETVDVTGFTGTPDATNYMRLTGGASNRHAGVTGTGHPRIESPSTGSGHVITIDEKYCVIEWLDLIQDSGTNSDECIRLNDETSELSVFSHLILHSTDATADQDGVYFANGGVSGTPETFYFDNCSIYNFYRGGIHHQNYSGEAHGTFYIDHCSIAWNGNRGAAEVQSGAIRVSQDHVNSITILNCYNNAMGETSNNAAEERDISDGPGSGRASPDGSVTWNGTHNMSSYGQTTPFSDIDGTNNTTNWQEASDGTADVTKTSGSWWVINNATYSLSTGDLTLLNGTDAGNLALTNGTNRQGSEPDSRQDFSVDGTGAVRPTTGVDIGFHQASAGSDGTATPVTIAPNTALAATGTGGGTITPTAIAPNTALASTATGGGTAAPVTIAPASALAVTGTGDGLIVPATIAPASAVSASGAGDGLAAPVTIAPVSALGVAGTGDGLAAPSTIAPASAVSATGAGELNGIAAPATIAPVIALGATGLGDGLAAPSTIAPTVAVAATGTGELNGLATSAAIAPATALAVTGTGSGLAAPVSIAPATALAVSGSGDGLAALVEGL